MLRYALLVVAGASISPCAAADAQATDPPPAVAASGGSSGTVMDCIAIGYVRDKIVLDRSREKIEITLDGGACESAPSGISGLTVSTSADGSDVIEDNGCPAYQEQIEKLWSERPHPVIRREYSSRGVHAGSFLIFNGNNLFDLQGARGRKAAVQWIYGTLAAVRSCWNNIRDDRTTRAADRLYTNLGIKLH